MLRASALVAVLALTVPLVVLHADDDGSAQATKQQSHSELKVESKEKRDRCRLRDKLKEILKTRSSRSSRWKKPRQNRGTCSLRLHWPAWR